MKKFLFAPLLVILTFLSCLTAAGQSGYKYTSAEGRFSIIFPGKPEESIDDQKANDSVVYKIHFATYAPTDAEIFMTGWLDMSAAYPEDRDMKAILEGSRDGATSSMKANKVTTLATHLGENPYIEFTFSTDEFTGKDRVYVINKHQYSLITIFSLKRGIPPAADKFIASFRPAAR